MNELEEMEIDLSWMTDDEDRGHVRRMLDAMADEDRVSFASSILISVLRGRGDKKLDGEVWRDDGHDTRFEFSFSDFNEAKEEGVGKNE